MIKIGSDFSGVGAFNQALQRLGINYEEIFACDMDKYARQTFIENYGEPKYYPENVYDREIPKESLDIYMTSPPCQAFSLAGKRKGENDKRGILFYNSHEFILKNKPRYFIFENVKGLLSDAKGRTFQIWLDMLGGKSVNGNPVIFPREDAVPYHVYWKVINAKDHGVPQNRERVFIIGIRDDKDNVFNFPKEEHLIKKLKDILETEVDEKYFLTDKTIDSFLKHKKRHQEKGTGFQWQPKDENDIANCLRANGSLCPTDNTLWIADYRNDEGLRIRKDNISPCMTSSMKGGEWKANQGTRNPPIVGFTNNKRLNENLEKQKGKLKDKMLLDSYNKTTYEDFSCTIDTRINASNNHHLIDTYKIRKLTPRECFRLMDFPDTFKWSVSDTQAYKQAGNSIVVNVLCKLISKLNL